MKNISSYYFIFIIPLVITIVFSATNRIRLDSFSDYILSYLLGVIIFFAGNYLRLEILKYLK